jgi:hypothetical protein
LMKAMRVFWAEAGGEAGVEVGVPGAAVGVPAQQPGTTGALPWSPCYGRVNKKLSARLQKPCAPRPRER